MGIGPSQGRYLHTEQHKHTINAYTDIHASSMIRTHNPSVRASEEGSWLGPRGHWDCQFLTLVALNTFVCLIKLGSKVTNIANLGLVSARRETKPIISGFCIGSYQNYQRSKCVTICPVNALCRTGQSGLTQAFSRATGEFFFFLIRQWLTFK
jgi:hypothetical protein